jgi:hypothetical protein
MSEKEVRDWHPDEQPDEEGPHNHHFTSEQADSLQEYIWTIRNMLGLRHWDIFLASVAADDKCNASIHPVYGRHTASLAVHKDWWSFSREVQRNTIVHEILHVAHNNQTEVIRTSETSIWMWRTFERETELMVDHLATALEDLFPLPDIPKPSLVKQVLEDLNEVSANGL